MGKLEWLLLGAFILSLTISVWTIGPYFVEEWYDTATVTNVEKSFDSGRWTYVVTVNSTQHGVIVLEKNLQYASTTLPQLDEGEVIGLVKFQAGDWYKVVQQ